MSLYANVTSVLSRKALNFRTLFTPAGNRVDVVVPVESIRAIRFANTAYCFFLGKRVAYPVVANYVRNTSIYARALIEVQANVELKDKIVVVMLILVEKWFYTCTVHVDSTSTTPIAKKIDKIERLIIDRKVTLVDDEGKPLVKVDSSSDHDSEDEVASVDNGMANFLA
nr:hypothetical protein [Tanacetum cinerariifolium]